MTQFARVNIEIVLITQPLIVMKTQQKSFQSYEVKVILLDDGDVLELREPKTYSFDDLMQEWEAGEPEFLDEDEWLAYKTDTYWLREDFISQLISLPFNRAFSNLDRLIYNSKDPRSLTYGLAQDLEKCVIGYNPRSFDKQDAFIKLRLLITYLTHVKINVRPKLKWNKTIADFCELMNAIYVVELGDSGISKPQFLEMLVDLVFDVNSEKSLGNLQATITQISKREKKVMYLNQLAIEYEHEMNKKYPSSKK